jgi:hypothetical protein
MHGGPVEQDQPTRDAWGERLALVVAAEILFAVLVDLVTGAPPAFVTTVVFGMMLALGLGWQTRRFPA